MVSQQTELFKLYNKAMKTMPGSPAQKKLEAQIAKLRKSLKMDEKLGKNATVGDYIDDFRKSDSPQFKGKSDKKIQKMAVAAYLDKKDKNEEDSNESLWANIHKKRQRIKRGSGERMRKVGEKLETYTEIQMKRIKVKK